MAKQRPVPPGGGKPANARDRQAAPARPQPAAAQPGPRRPFPGDPSDHRPIAGPLLQRTLPVQYPGPPAAPRAALPAPDDRPGATHDAGDDETTAELPGLVDEISRLARAEAWLRGPEHGAAAGGREGHRARGSAAPDRADAAQSPPLFGRPTPSPRRTPSAENAALTGARPYPVAPFADRAGPGTHPASGMPLTAAGSVGGSRPAPGRSSG